METDHPRTAEPDETAAAFRRAAIEQHHRQVTAELESSPGRDAIETAFARAPEPSSVVVIRIDDLPDDGFGNTLVDQIGTRLRSIVREPIGVHHLGSRDPGSNVLGSNDPGSSDPEGRPSGTRFLVVLPGDRYTADAVARRAVLALADPFSVGGRDLTMHVRAGIAEVDGDDPVGTVRRADLAAHRSPRDAG